MKPTSIVFLVLSLLLIAGGVITCSVARDIALTDNYPLFSESENGESYSRHPFDAEDVNKIELLVSDAEINIIGGADECAVELHNFQEGLYAFSATASVVSFDEIPDLKSLLSFKSGFSFSGLRYYLRRGSDLTKPKRIDVYLTADSALRILNIEGERVSVNADKVLAQFDISVSAAKDASLHLTDYRTACALNASAKTLTMELNSSYVHAFSVTADEIDMNADELYFDDMTLKVQKGSLYILSTAGIARYGFDLRGSGKFTLADAETALPYKADPPGISKIMISGDLGEADFRLDDIAD